MEEKEAQSKCMRLQMDEHVASPNIPLPIHFSLTDY